MKRVFLSACVLALGLTAFLVPVAAEAEPPRYRVSVTNVTRAQSFTPILIATHRQGVRLFNLGDSAGSELEALAEDGDTGPLTGLLMSMGNMVGDIKTVGGLLGPGETRVAHVAAGGPYNHISVAAMLIPTNDTFFAVNGVRGPIGRTVVLSPGYDAGTEDNDETCASIPGPNYPECGGPGGGGAPPGGEGFVYVNGGVQGVGDFDASRDWRNPVARIVIERVTGQDDEGDDEHDD